MRRSESRMEEQDAYRLLRDCLWVTLSTVNAREDAPLGLGSPYAVPISVVESDGEFYFHSALAGHKVENLRQDSRVCITAVLNAEVVEKALSVAYESATFFARVEEVTEQSDKKRVLHSLCKRFAPSEHPARQIESLVDSTGIWKLHIYGCSAKQRKFE